MVILDPPASIGSPTKRLRSQAPDVVVVVGRGDEKEEFQCYKIVLSLASEYFDTMLSTAMKENLGSRIEFPEKDPKEWKLFYSFVDPTSTRSAKITEDNEKVLLPWFHEFQMSDLLQECDETFVQDDAIQVDWQQISSSWSQEKVRAKMYRLLALLSMSELYGLAATQTAALRAVTTILNHASHIMDDFVALCQLAPFLQRTLLWNAIVPFLPEHLDKSDADALTKNDLLIHLVQAGIKAQFISKVRGETTDRIKFTMERVLELPFWLYDRLPARKSFGTKIDIQARRVLRRIIHDQLHGSDMIDIPEAWSSEPRKFCGH